MAPKRVSKPIPFPPYDKDTHDIAEKEPRPPCAGRG